MDWFLRSERRYRFQRWFLLCWNLGAFVLNIAVFHRLSHWPHRWLFLAIAPVAAFGYILAWRLPRRWSELDLHRVTVLLRR